MSELERLVANQEKAQSWIRGWIWAFLGCFFLVVLASFFVESAVVLALLASCSVICALGGIIASARKDRAFVRYWRVAGLNDEQIAQKREEFFPQG